MTDKRSDPRQDEPPITLLAIVGPTAVGKSAVAMRIAPELGAEIISVDSMQVYRGMDIGTSKPDEADMERVDFHLVDVSDPGCDFSVAAFKEMAEGAVRDVAARGKLPMLVGGSGLYYRAVVDDLDFAGVRGEGRSGREPAGDISDRELHATLERSDPAAAREIDPSNRKRVIRAIEVARGGGRLISARQDSWVEYRSPYRLVAAGLEMDRALMYQLIDLRVDRMISMGLADEVRRLKLEGLRAGSTAGEALGYRQLLRYIDGDSTLDDAVGEIKRRTRQFARRQITWFRKDPRVMWFRVEGKIGDRKEDVEQGLERAAALVLEYIAGKLEN
ncbi:MAG: tRNA (adenosine(37)-N6)-dimethylallyltransferase MiaA [Actinobacteria bacterium]|nr:tRNA (adenosine(37)-N6)-dimethylallyltransferase MiaA [Actinomycetota bacterium]MBU4490003.1 tRNA (adenosine(37)-N6)-dimethylallyltransferase MiaA [Actinomycetota bacterium]MCG2794962.1 tRNA (adenosine(37)-N6)-dimethylallyltransferase MiaA [Actinomycetes bacterium]